jgi:hypothetical protein
MARGRKVRCSRSECLSISPDGLSPAVGYSGAFDRPRSAHWHGWNMVQRVGGSAPAPLCDGFGADQPGSPGPASLLPPLSLPIGSRQTSVLNPFPSAWLFHVLGHAALTTTSCPRSPSSRPPPRPALVQVVLVRVHTKYSSTHRLWLPTPARCVLCVLCAVCVCAARYAPNSPLLRCAARVQAGSSWRAPASQVLCAVVHSSARPPSRRPSVVPPSLSRLASHQVPHPNLESSACVHSCALSDSTGDSNHPSHPNPV